MHTFFDDGKLFCTSTSGADAPAVMPRRRTSANQLQSMSAARCTSQALPQPALFATSTSRTEFEELGAPTISMASHSGAIDFTASWRLVVA
jgi:hypothetical protein